MKPSSKNEVMNGIVNAYIAQKALDKANNTHYADTWKILNGADDEIDASLKFDLSEGEWDSVKAYLKENKISFALCLISYKDGHSQNSFVWYDNEHIYAVEMNEIGSVSFHVVDNANKEIVKPTDETSSSILKMLLALENGGANGGGGEVTTKQVFKGGVDILDKPLDVESKATFGNDVDVDGKLTINSASDLKTKDGTSLGGGDILDWSSKAITDKGITLTSLEIEELKKHAKLKVNIAGLLVFIIDYAIAEEDNSMLVTVPYTARTGFGISGFVIKLENNVMSYSVISIPLGIQVNGNQLELADTIEYNPYVNTINGTQVLASDSVHDIKVQSILYRHAVTIYEGNKQDGNSICFTTYTPSNTPIDSIQDLTASADGSNKLANTDLECFGVSGTASALTFYNKIHVGTSITNTTLQKATGGSATLASVYASYTMKDDVTLN